jgi:hypothetical protein
MSSDAEARLALKPLVRKSFSPGPGWQHMAGAVWERGPVRVHMGGIVRLQDGTIISEKAVHHRYQQVALLVRINGGNRKRGLLAWARLLASVSAS